MSEQEMNAGVQEGSTTDESLLTTATPEGEANEPTIEPNEAGEENTRPEWLASKYDTVEAQAEAYNDLASKFGGFEGAPDDGYAFEIPENAEYELDQDHPQYVAFLELAKESNMNQATFDKFMGIYTEDILSGQVDQEEEIAKIGDNFELRRDTIVKFMDTSGMSQDAKDQIGQMARTSEGFKAAEELLGLVKGTEPSVTRNDNAEQSTGPSAEEVAALQADPLFRQHGAKGNEHRAKVARLWKEVYPD